ncbi:LysM peptidoglycan-binding domain-containing protein [Streptomyces sp. NPDC001903]|uniref:LysM peptidoglycan-binding domain-containing protein n=1 Tax=Streptomyces sp. NPDC001903 TaxID=3364622 RepID=UPI003684CC7E
MGLFDFLKSDKKKHEAAEKAAAAASADYAAKYSDGVSATKAAAERMAAAARPKAAPAPHTPTPTSAAHKAVPAAPAPAPASAPKPMPAAKKRTYTVRSGDSLSAIARRELGNEARWRELYAMNRGVIGSNPELIHPGQVLTLPH